MPFSFWYQPPKKVVLMKYHKLILICIFFASSTGVLASTIGKQQISQNNSFLGSIDDASDIIRIEGWLNSKISDADTIQTIIQLIKSENDTSDLREKYLIENSKSSYLVLSILQLLSITCSLMSIVLLVKVK